jgi:hypothetical protein
MTTPCVILTVELETIEDYDGPSIRLCLLLFVCCSITSDKSVAQCGQDRISLYKHLSIGHGQANFLTHVRLPSRSTYRQKILSRRQILIQMRQVDSACFYCTHGYCQSTLIDPVKFVREQDGLVFTFEIKSERPSDVGH